MKIHFALAFPHQCFCQGWQNLILRALVFTWATSAKTLTRSKLVKLLPLLYISPRIGSIICTIIVVQILFYKYCYTQSNVLFSSLKNFVLRIILDALFEFKSKDKYERKILNRLKRNFNWKIYINCFCLMSQVLFYLVPVDEQMVKEWNKIKVVQKCDVTEFCWYNNIRCESKACSTATWTKRKRMIKMPKIYNWADFL